MLYTSNWRHTQFKFVVRFQSSVYITYCAFGIKHRCPGDIWWMALPCSSPFHTPEFNTVWYRFWFNSLLRYRFCRIQTSPQFMRYLYQVSRCWWHYCPWRSLNIISCPTANLDWLREDMIEAGEDMCFIFEWLASYLTSNSFLNETRQYRYVSWSACVIFCLLLATMTSIQIRADERARARKGNNVNILSVTLGSYQTWVKYHFYQWHISQ